MPRFRPLNYAALLLLSVVACSSPAALPTDDPDVLISQDFDSLNGWVGTVADASAANTLTTLAAHSGRCAARIGGAVEYGVSFTAPLGQLLKRRPKALEVSYWCYRTDASGNAATLVCTITRPSTKQQLYWKGANMAEDVKRDRYWTKVTQRIDIPAEVDFSDELRLYPWRGAATSDVYFDDLQLRVIND